jgi:hypothetical protein
VTERLVRDRYKYSIHQTELLPPPEGVRFRWLELLQQLRVDWRTTLTLPAYEVPFRRHIVRWVMGEYGARRSLPAGMVFHAWLPDDFDKITVIRTR